MAKTKWSRNQKLLLVSVLIPVFACIVVIVGWVIAPIAENYIDMIFDKNKKQTITEEITITPSYTIAPSKTFTTTKTITITNTVTSTTSLTPSPTKSILEDFIIREDCLPLGWSNFSKTIIPIGQTCLTNLEKIGITPKNNGIEFVIQPTVNDNIQNYLENRDIYLNGIYFQKPKEIERIRFTINVRQLKTTPYDADLNFFFGNIYPEKIRSDESFGKFVNFRIASLDGEPAPVIIVLENPIYSKKSSISSFSLFEKQEIVIQFSELTYKIQIDGKTYSSLDNLPLPNDDFYFAFGYTVPLNGGLSVTISDLEFNK